LEYFIAFWYILWPFGIFYGYLVHFSRFGMLCQEKSGSPGSKTGNTISSLAAGNAKKETVTTLGEPLRHIGRMIRFMYI
jgi:hypothetical protein